MSPSVLSVGFFIATLTLCGLSWGYPASQQPGEQQCPFRACECVKNVMDPPNVYVHVTCEVDQSTDFSTLFAADRKYRVKGTLTISGSVQKLPANVFKSISSMDALSLVQQPTAAQAEFDPAAFDGVSIGRLSVANLTEVIPVPEAVKRLGPRGLKELTIVAANSLSLDANFLDGFDELRTFAIHDTPITKIHDDAFANVARTLSEFAMTNASLSKYPRNAIKKLAHLYGLNLSNNRINDIQNDDLSSFSRIIRLVLSGNDLAAAVQSGVLDKLPASLTDLTLDKCGLKSIPASVLAGNPPLTALSVIGNEIDSLKAGDFPEVNNIQRLYLRQNPIAKIENGSLNVLKGLEILEMKQTALTSFDLSMCNDMNRVILELGDNSELKTIDASAVDVPDYHHGLSELFLGNTSVEKLDPKLNDVINSVYFDRIILTDNKRFVCDESSHWMAKHALCVAAHLDIDDTVCSNVPNKSLRDYLREQVPNPCQGHMITPGKH